MACYIAQSDHNGIPFSNYAKRLVRGRTFYQELNGEVTVIGIYYLTVIASVIGASEVSMCSCVQRVYALPSPNPRTSDSNPRVSSRAFPPAKRGYDSPLSSLRFTEVENGKELEQ